MNINVDLPDISDEARALMAKQANTWEPTLTAASVGHRFWRLNLLIKLNAPTAIVDHSKRLLAEAMYRYEIMRNHFEDGWSTDND
jgi:prophage tail gpP-like protein